MVTVEQKIEHLRKLGLTGDMSEIAKMYRGEKFDPKDAEYQKLLSLSKSYCQRFTELSSLIAVAKSPEEATKYSNEKSAILDILFPYHGQIFGGGDDLYAVIGTVELDGFNYINTRVHFNGSSLVHLNPYVFVASSVDFGEKKEVTRMGTIEVGADTWIGAKVIFDDNTRIGQRSVIGMGSHVVSGANLAASTISFGNPCHEYMPIPEDYETVIKVPGQEAQRTKDEIEFLIIFSVSLAAAALFAARFLTSSATTANPFPCFPDLAASTAAFRERRFVWNEISSMVLIILLIFLDESLISSIDWTIFCISA